MSPERSSETIQRHRLVDEFAFAPNLSLTLKGYSLEAALRAVRAAGLNCFEFWFPQQFDIDSMRALRDQYALRVSAFDLDIPLDAWTRGFLANPDALAGVEFQKSLERGLQLAELLQCRKLIALVGNVQQNYSEAQQIRTAVMRLHGVLPLLVLADVTLLVEPINGEDNPGYFLTSLTRANDIVRAVDSSRVRLLLDTYHLFRMGLDPAETIEACRDCVGHIQLGDAPSRGEPGTGQIDFASVFDAIRAIDYVGDIGLEYIPTIRDHPLRWLSEGQ